MMPQPGGMLRQASADAVRGPAGASHARARAAKRAAQLSLRVAAGGTSSVKRALGQHVRLIQLLEDRPVTLMAPFVITVR